MDTVWQAIVRDMTSMPLDDVVVAGVRMLAAAILCGLIGLERQVRQHVAGLKTNMLVGVAAAAFAAIASQMIIAAEDEHLRLDPLRLIEAVTGGAAFLAAGLIVFARGRVRGLTSGASLWLSAAVGLAIGVGLWPIGLAAATLGFLVLVLMREVEARFGIDTHRRFDQGSGDGPDRSP